jgi:hypothetical protein
VCPYELFENTKSDLGAHPNRETHDEEAKAQWDELQQEEKDKYGYEYELMDLLDNLVHQCDKRIEKNKERAQQVCSCWGSYVLCVMSGRRLHRFQENQYSEEEIKKIFNLDNQIKQTLEESGLY